MSAPTDLAARVRFAPSPTGFLHVGSARTALFNWIYARSVGGRMLLRIEDTDEARNRPELVDLIYDLLSWLGIDWDEEPVFQSQRRERHREAVESLLAAGAAYLCDAENRPVSGTALRPGLAARFRMPRGRTVAFTDVVRGEVSFASDDLEDFVVWRSAGAATFLLANAVDDVDMGVTHAIRGEDLLSGVPKVVLLLEALGAEAPIYAHLPLLVTASRKKLSKRRDDVSLGDYRARGYLPEAMANHLALLGWGPTDGVEIRPMAEIVAQFRLSDVNRAPAFFDTKKLEHFNGVYIRALSTEEVPAPLGAVAGRRGPVAPRADAHRRAGCAGAGGAGEGADAGRHRALRGLAVPRRAPRRSRVVDQGDGRPGRAGSAGRRHRHVCRGGLDGGGDPRRRAGTGGAPRACDSARPQAPIRVAITGRTVGPPLFESMVLLDRAEVLRRLRNARTGLEG